MLEGSDKGNAAAGWACLSSVLVIVSLLLGSCGPATEAPPFVPVPTVEATWQTATVTPTSAASATPQLPGSGMLGLGLRRQTVPIVARYKDHPGLVTCASIDLAEERFPALEGWIRMLGAPSLEALRQKAEEAEKRGVPYEALGYGLETSHTTPQEEWRDLVGSTQKARAIADEYGKLLLMAPGLRLMSHSRDQYSAMAALADMWIVQTQRLQVDPPGEAYREAVKQEVDPIRSGNANIEIWAQITLPPDRDPNAEEWLAYRQSIADLVDGTYIGVYTWASLDADLLVATIEEILAAAIADEQ